MFKKNEIPKLDKSSCKLDINFPSKSSDQVLQLLRIKHVVHKALKSVA